jgi:hypothetical protein
MAPSHDDAITKKAVKDNRLHNIWFPIESLVTVANANNKEEALKMCQTNKALGLIFAPHGWTNNRGTSTDLKYTAFKTSWKVMPTGAINMTHRKFYYISPISDDQKRPDFDQTWQEVYDGMHKKFNFQSIATKKRLGPIQSDQSPQQLQPLQPQQAAEVSPVPQQLQQAKKRRKLSAEEQARMLENAWKEKHPDLPCPTFTIGAEEESQTKDKEDDSVDQPRNGDWKKVKVGKKIKHTVWIQKSGY